MAYDELYRGEAGASLVFNVQGYRLPLPASPPAVYPVLKWWISDSLLPYLILKSRCEGSSVWKATQIFLLLLENPVTSNCVLLALLTWAVTHIQDHMQFQAHSFLSLLLFHSFWHSQPRLTKLYVVLGEDVRNLMSNRCRLSPHGKQEIQ